MRARNALTLLGRWGLAFALDGARLRTPFRDAVPSRFGEARDFVAELSPSNQGSP